jgi:hypothetical protein
MRHHYVYYSYEEFGRGYIGSRTCNCLPEEDTDYFGSFTEKTFNPVAKIILKSDYKTRREATADEVILHNAYDIAKNPHFVNRAKQRGEGFSTEGTKLRKETRQKLSEAKTGRNLSENHRLKISRAQTGEKNHNYGKPLSEEAKQNLSEKNSGEGNPMFGKTGDNHPVGGTTWWVNSNCDTIRRSECPGPGWQPGRKWR